MSQYSEGSTYDAQRDEAATANLITHMSWLPQRVPGMRVNAGEHLILVDSGLPTDTFNVVCGARLNQRNVRERIAWVVNYFQTVARPFSWWVGPGDQPSYLGEALVSAGLEAAESETAMFADLNALNEVKPLPPGLRIERAQTPEQIRAFAAVVAANWMPPDTAVLDFYEAATPFLLRPDAPLRLYVGYWNGVPVASSELTIGGGVVGLYNVCTLETHRRQGIGGSMTLRPLLDARAQGHREAILQASDAGQRVYTRLGFQPSGQFTEYKLPALIR